MGNGNQLPTARRRRSADYKILRPGSARTHIRSEAAATLRGRDLRSRILLIHEVASALLPAFIPARGPVLFWNLRSKNASVRLDTVVSLIENTHPFPAISLTLRGGNLPSPSAARSCQ